MLNRILYEFRQTGINISDWMMSLPFVAPSVPVNIHVLLYGPAVVAMYWNPPDRRNGVIVQYIVNYTSNIDSSLPEWQKKTENGLHSLLPIQQTALVAIRWHFAVLRNKSYHIYTTVCCTIIDHIFALCICWCSRLEFPQYIYYHQVRPVVLRSAIWNRTCGITSRCAPCHEPVRVHTRKAFQFRREKNCISVCTTSSVHIILYFCRCNKAMKRVCQLFMIWIFFNIIHLKVSSWFISSFSCHRSCPQCLIWWQPQQPGTWHPHRFCDRPHLHSHLRTHHHPP